MRECIANLYSDYYQNNTLNDTVKLSKATKDNILTTVPQEGILIAMQCILSKGDDIIVLSPLYQSLYEHAIQIKCNNLIVLTYHPVTEPWGILQISMVDV